MLTLSAGILKARAVMGCPSDESSSNHTTVSILHRRSISSCERCSAILRPSSCQAGSTCGSGPCTVSKRFVCFPLGIVAPASTAAFAGFAFDRRVDLSTSSRFEADAEVDADESGNVGETSGDEGDAWGGIAAEDSYGAESSGNEAEALAVETGRDLSGKKSVAVKKVHAKGGNEAEDSYSAVSSGDEAEAPVVETDSYLLGDESVTVKEENAVEEVTTQKIIKVWCIVETRWIHPPSKATGSFRATRKLRRRRTRKVMMVKQDVRM